MLTVVEFYVIISTQFDELLLLGEIAEKLINDLVITALLIATTFTIKNKNNNDSFDMCKMLAGQKLQDSHFNKWALSALGGASTLNCVIDINIEGSIFIWMIQINIHDYSMLFMYFHGKSIHLWHTTLPSSFICTNIDVNHLLLSFEGYEWLKTLRAYEGLCKLQAFHEESSPDFVANINPLVPDVH